VSKILKLIFDWVVGQYQISNDPLTNWVILGVVGFAAAMFSYQIVGRLYAEGFIDGSGAGAVLNAIIKFIIMTLFAIVAVIFISVVGGVFWFIKFLMTLHWWIWVIVGAVVIAVIVLVILHKRKRKQSAKL
jgi:hypothetical protein